MDIIQKKLFIKQMEELQRMAVSKSASPQVIRNELMNLQARLRNLLELIKMYREGRKIQESILELEETANNNILQILWMKSEITNSQKEDSQLPIINKPLNSKIKSSEVVLYACKISSFCQTIPRIRMEDTLNPWSFGSNVVGIPEIEQSGVYLMYKNNPEYKMLAPPTISFILQTQQYVKEQINLDNHTVSIKATQPVEVFIHKDLSEAIVYTLDESEPNPYDANPDYPLEQSVSIRSQYTTLKVKRFRAGYISSHTATYKFEILDNFNEKATEEFRAGMQRPDALDELSAIGDGYEDLYDSGGAYTSLHLQHTYSTPTQSQY